MLNDRQLSTSLSTLFLVLVLGFVAIPVPAFSGSQVGHLLGILGTALMGMTLAYPYRKRIQGKKGKANPLDAHVYYGLVGPVLVVVHSGHAFASLIGNLTFLAMLLVVLSGMVGRHYFKMVNRSVKAQQEELKALESMFEARRREALAVAGEAEDEVAGADEGVFADEASDLRELAQSIAEREYRLRMFNATQRTFSLWATVHIYLTVLLFSLVLIHVYTTIYYGLRWLP